MLRRFVDDADLKRLIWFNQATIVFHNGESLSMDRIIYGEFGKAELINHP